jgi:hypothetical protein
MLGHAAMSQARLAVSVRPMSRCRQCSKLRRALMMCSMVIARGAGMSGALISYLNVISGEVCMAGTAITAGLCLDCSAQSAAC